MAAVPDRMSPAIELPRNSSPHNHRVIVGIGELSVSRNPAETLSTYGLGSCVGIAAYDPIARAGGLIHIMLPRSAIDPRKAAVQPAMFADTGMPLLVQALLNLPADPNRLRFLIAGGAAMLRAPEDFNLGNSNVGVTLEFLTQHNLLVCHREIGGTDNRTLHFDVGTGILTLKTGTGSTVYSLANV
jgi:chemotaxis protein CheD